MSSLFIPSGRLPLPAMLFGLLFCLYSLSSEAGVMLGGTRIIFDGTKRDTSISVKNTTKQAYAVQAWVNTEADDDTVATPFIATPPLFRLDPNKEQMVRIIKVPDTLPTDRESVFYFNAQEIPVAGTTDTNTLKVALRTRIKLFYRPATLTGTSAEAPSLLSWALSREGAHSWLEVKNTSNFHVSFIGLKVANSTRDIEVKEPRMIAPHTSDRYRLEGFQRSGAASVTFSTINDYGGYSAPLLRPLNSAK